LGVERQEVMADETIGMVGTAVKAKTAELYKKCVERSDASTEAEKKQCAELVSDFLENLIEESEDHQMAVRTFLNSKFTGFDRKGNPIFCVKK